MKIQYDLFIFWFQRLDYMHENKDMRLYIYIYVSTKIRYFNTGFVFLRYKNTNQYWAKWIEKHKRKTQIFKKYIFLIIFFYWAGPEIKLGWDQPK
jgi:hypothetical protein